MISTWVVNQSIIVAVYVYRKVTVSTNKVTLHYSIMLNEHRHECLFLIVTQDLMHILGTTQNKINRWNKPTNCLALYGRRSPPNRSHTFSVFILTHKLKHTNTTTPLPIRLKLQHSPIRPNVPIVVVVCRDREREDPLNCNSKEPSIMFTRHSGMFCAQTVNDLSSDIRLHLGLIQYCRTNPWYAL